MARFWFRNDAAKQTITEELNQLECGKILSAAELRDLGCDFEGNQFGETIFLLDPGTLIVLSCLIPARSSCRATWDSTASLECTATIRITKILTPHYCLM
jgi:hypothetical protein